MMKKVLTTSKTVALSSLLERSENTPLRAVRSRYKNPYEWSVFMTYIKLGHGPVAPGVLHLYPRSLRSRKIKT